MSEKTKYPRTAALAVAKELCDALKPVTERLIVAGSLRRGKSEVGDVEILFVPKFEERPVDMFSTCQWSLVEDALSSLLGSGVLSKRPNTNGAFSWGDKNKLALHRSGIPVDFFTATGENWWNYLVCRTGPGESNIRICMEAQKRGWKWNPYGNGFSRPSTGEQYVTTSEEDVFKFVGLPYFPPRERTAYPTPQNTGGTV